MWGVRKWALCVANLLSGSLEFNLKIERKLVSAGEAWGFARLMVMESGRRSERRSGLCRVLDEYGGGKIIPLYKHKVDSYVEQQRPKDLSAYGVDKL